MTLTALRLKRLVRYREQLERLQEQRLALAARAHAERVARLAESRAERLAALLHELPCEPTALRARIDFITRADREIAAREAAVAHAADRVEAERAVLLEKSRDRKAMETMLDRRVDLDRQERRHAERKHLDDIAGRRWFDRQASQP